MWVGAWVDGAHLVGEGNQQVVDFTGAVVRVFRRGNGLDRALLVWIPRDLEPFFDHGRVQEQRQIIGYLDKRVRDRVAHLSLANSCRNLRRRP